MAQRAERMSAEKRRKVILEAARRVFSRNSYRHATTLDVAKEAGISQPALFKYFPSKRGLFLEVLNMVNDEGDAAMQSASDPVVAVRQWCAACFHKSSDFFQMLKMALHAVSESEDTEIAQKIGEMCAKRQKQLAEMLAIAQNSGELSARIPPHLAGWMFLSLGLLAHISSITEMEGFTPEDMEALSSHFLEMMQ